MTKNGWVALAALVGSLAWVPAQAGTVSTTMTVSVIVVAPESPRRAEPARSGGETTEAAAGAPVAVVEDPAARTRMIIY